MSDFAYSLSGATPIIHRYQVDATVANPGVPMLIDTAGEAGLNAGTTTSAADFVGMTVDTVTYTTTQGTGADSAERLVGVVTQPDAVWRARMSGGAAEGTALTLNPILTANAGGTSIIMTNSVATPSMDEGVLWGFDGANVGQSRKITAVASATATVTIPFDNGTVIGDNFLHAPYWFNATTAIQLTTNLFEADASIAVATGGEYVVVGLELNDRAGEGDIKSSVLFMALDHVLAGRPT